MKSLMGIKNLQLTQKLKKQQQQQKQNKTRIGLGIEKTNIQTQQSKM